MELRVQKETPNLLVACVEVSLAVPFQPLKTHQRGSINIAFSGSKVVVFPPVNLLKVCSWPLQSFCSMRDNSSEAQHEAGPDATQTLEKLGLFHGCRLLQAAYEANLMGRYILACRTVEWSLYNQSSWCKVTVAGSMPSWHHVVASKFVENGRYVRLVFTRLSQCTLGKQGQTATWIS